VSFPCSLAIFPPRQNRFLKYPLRRSASQREKDHFWVRRTKTFALQSDESFKVADFGINDMTGRKGPRQRVDPHLVTFTARVPSGPRSGVLIAAKFVTNPGPGFKVYDLALASGPQNADWKAGTAEQVLRARRAGETRRTVPSITGQPARRKPFLRSPRRAYARVRSNRRKSA